MVNIMIELDLQYAVMKAVNGQDIVDYLAKFPMEDYQQAYTNFLNEHLRQEIPNLKE